MYRYIFLFFIVFSGIATGQPQLFFNANGYTLTSDGPLKKFSCLLVADGKVMSTATNCEPADYPAAIKTDVKGQTLLPGLTDAHGHVFRLGELLMRLDLRGIPSKTKTLKALSTYAKENPSLPWIHGSGWNQVLWTPKLFPRASDFDELQIDRPIWLIRVDGHAGWANQKAMALAGITKQTPDPAGGKIVRDKQGNATGIFIDNAMGLVERHIPEPTTAYRQKSLDVASQHLLSLGITATHDAGISFPEYKIYKERAEKNTLMLRFYPMLSVTDAKFDTMLSAGIVDDPLDFLSIRSVKVYGDGALGSRGAAMLKPYSDSPHEAGLLVTPKKRLPELFDKILGSGFQLNMHAIGDRANRLALKHFESSFKRVGGKPLRNRIEHAQVVNPDDIPAFKKLGLIASMQPTHATSDKNMAQDRIGASRMSGAYAWQTFLGQGTVLAAGSDYPIESANIFHGLHAAITRQDHNNKPKGGWFPEHALSRPQALRAFSLDAAYAGHNESMLGSLEAGKWADFIIIDRDVFTVPAKQIWQTQALQTWVAGKQVFVREGS